MINLSTIEQIRRKIVIWFGASILALATIAATGHIVMTGAIEKNHHTVAVLRQASNEIELAQRIGFLVNELYTSEQPQARLDAMFELDATIAKLRDHHADNLVMRRMMSEKVDQIYFAKNVGVDARISQFVQSVSGVINSPDFTAEQRIAIVSQLPGLSRRLELVYKEYEAATKAAVDHVLHLEQILFIATMIALLCLIAFSFIPLLRSQREVVEEALDMDVALTSERETNKMQRQFIAMVSHEFRTPLAIIDGRARRMARKAERLTPDEARENGGVMRRSVARLVSLTESVLTASKIDEGTVDFKPKEADVMAMLEEETKTATELFEGQKFTVDIEVDAREAFTKSIHDPILLRQVVSNLLSNAGKYAESKTGVILYGALSESRQDLIIEIIDDGVGIPPEELERIFSRFFRASTSSNLPGTGIGLYIVQHFVSLHGGYVEVESEPGEGSIFRVVIPRDVGGAEISQTEAA